MTSQDWFDTRVLIPNIYVLSSLRVAATIHIIFLFYCNKRRFWWRKCSYHVRKKKDVENRSSIIQLSHYFSTTIAFCVCDSKDVRRRKLWRMALDFHSRGSHHNSQRRRLLFFHCRLAGDGKVPQRPGASSAASPNTWGPRGSENGPFWQEIRCPRFWRLEDLRRVGDTSLATLHQNPPLRVKKWLLKIGVADDLMGEKKRILMYLGVTNTGYAVSFFSPTILHQLGWSSVKAQVLTIPIYSFAFFVTVGVSVLTDRLQHRYAFAMLGVFSGTIGYIILLLQVHVAFPVRYIAIFFVLTGSAVTQPIALVWLNNNLGGHVKRSVGSALQIGFGNCAGIVASCIFITAESPTYPVGYGVSLALLWVSGLASTVFMFGLWRENRKRDKGDRDDRLQLPREELENLGDDHPRYRYVFWWVLSFLHAKFRTL